MTVRLKFYPHITRDEVFWIRIEKCIVNKFYPEANWAAPLLAGNKMQFTLYTKIDVSYPIPTYVQEPACGYTQYYY